MAVVADVGLVARYLCSALTCLPSVGVSVFSSWELGGRERYKGGWSWLFFVLSLLFWCWRVSFCALFPNSTLEAVAQLEGRDFGRLLFPLPLVPKRLVSWTPLLIRDKTGTC